MNRGSMMLLIDALRSGKFKQCCSQLKDAEGDCCVFGVACELYSEHVQPLTQTVSVAGGYAFNRVSLLPPACVLEWLGIYKGDGMFNSIIGMNSRLPFAKIADYLELELEREYDSSNL